MDPMANMTAQLELAQKMNELDDQIANGDRLWMDEDEQTDYIEWAGQLAELVLALHEWRTKGGFDPYNTTYDNNTGC